MKATTKLHHFRRVSKEDIEEPGTLEYCLLEQEFRSRDYPGPIGAKYHKAEMFMIITFQKGIIHKTVITHGAN